MPVTAILYLDPRTSYSIVIAACVACVDVHTPHMMSEVGAGTSHNICHMLDLRFRRCFCGFHARMLSVLHFITRA